MRGLATSFKSDPTVKDRVRAQNPDADFAAFGKALSQEWSSLSDEDKQPYLDRAAEEQEAFKKESESE